MKIIINYIKNNRLKVIVISILLICFIGALIFIKNDYFLYKETIVKVINVKEEKVEEKKISSYNQFITAKIMNGKHKGKTVNFENNRSYSGVAVYDYNISKGDELFVSLSGDKAISNIHGFKRDFIIALEIFAVCFILILVTAKKSILFLLSTFINIAIFALILLLREKEFNIFLLFIFGTILFTVLTLLIIVGFNKKSICAIVSTLISSVVMMVIALIVFKLYSDDIHYEFIEFSEFFYDYEEVFYSSILISGLGAIMDSAVIMSSGINELINKNPKITTKELRKSAWIIAEDVMGTMINILFFACIVGAIPLVVYLTVNQTSITFAFTNYGLAEIVRSLVGAIGIVLSIPISYFVNMVLRKRVKL